MGTKLSDRDVHALMAFAGRRLQDLHLGTSIIEGIYCLRCKSQHLRACNVRVVTQNSLSTPILLTGHRTALIQRAAHVFGWGIYLSP